MISNTSEYFENTYPLFINQQNEKLEVLKGSPLDSFSKAMFNGDEATICNLLESKTIPTALLLEHLKTYDYSENELKIFTNAIFYTKSYEFLNDCLDAKINLILIVSLSGNPFVNLLLEQKYDLFLKLSSVPCSSSELLDEALDVLLNLNKFEDAKLLINTGASLAKISHNRFSDIYNSNYPIYRYFIDQLHLSQTSPLSHPGLLHQLIAAQGNFSQIKDRAEWLKDLEELVKLGFSPNEEFFFPLFCGTSLDFAFQRGQRDVCKLFVKLLGKDPKNTRLHDAILYEECEKITSMLHDFPFGLYNINYNRQTPLDLIVEGNRLDLLPILASYAHFSSQGVLGQTVKPKKFTHKPDLRALQNHHFEMAQFLWDMGLDFIDLNEFNIRYNFNKKNEIILEQIKIIRSTEPKINRLLTACESDDYHIFKEIFETQPWLAHVMIAQKCPFGVAVHHSSQTIIDFFLKQGFSIFGNLEKFHNKDFKTWKLGRSYKESFNSGSVPFYDALKLHLKTASKLLDSIPELPIIDEILLNEDKISKIVKCNYLMLVEILEQLIIENDMNSVLFLASHPKTKNAILRIGIIYALEKTNLQNKFWLQEKNLEKLIQAGFDLNGFIVQIDDVIKTPLLYAIYSENIVLIQFLIDHGAFLHLFVDRLYPVQCPFEAACEDTSKIPNIEILLVLLKAAKKLPVPMDTLLIVASSFPKDDRLVVDLLERKGLFTSAEIKIIAKNFMTLIFDSQYDIEFSLLELFQYGNTYLTNFDEWNNFIKEVDQLAKSILAKFSNLQPNQKGESGIARLINQIYFHIFCGSNPQLTKEPNVIERITQLLLNSSPELHDKILLTLQVSPSLAAVEKATDFHKTWESKTPLPPSAFFKIQGDFQITLQMMIDFAHEETDSMKSWFSGTEAFKLLKDNDFIALKEYFSTLLHCDFDNSEPLNVKSLIAGWLNYFAVYRKRSGLVLCNHILKYQKDSPELIHQALIVLERLAIKRWNKSIENVQINEIISIVKTTSDFDIKNQAVKTLWVLSADSTNEILKKLFVQELQKLDVIHPQQIVYALTLIELLGNFDYSNSKIGTKTAKILRQLMQHIHIDIVYQAVMAISKTDDREGLFECLQAIEGPVWYKHEDSYGLNAKDALGSYLTFRHRPENIHDNRHAMRLRILDRLALLESSSTPEFKMEIQRRYDKFIEDPSCNIELGEFRDHFYKIERSSTRFVGLPLYFPSGCAIGRGLSTRGGNELFFESVRDLIKKGCGTTDLSLETSVVEGQTWGRIGHTFGSHNSKLFFQGEKIYFYGSNSAFLVISTDYFNSEFMRGDARMESEGSLNTLWYRGIPKKYLQAIFLEKQNINDIELLSGNKSIQSILEKGLLTSPIFKGQSLKELVHLRRHLLAKDNVMIKGVEYQLSFVDRIKYYDSSKKPSLTIDEVESCGFKFVDEKELLEESLKRAIGRQLILEKL